MQLLKEKPDIGRMNFRVDLTIKNRIAKAAHIVGQDLTEFAVSTLNEKAQDIIERYDRFELSESEKSDLFALLDSAVSKPTRRSVEAVKRYNKLIDDGRLEV